MGHEEQKVQAYFCRSSAVPVTPLHNKITRPTIATTSRKRVRVRKVHMALVGGSLACAAFQDTPFLGNSMAICSYDHVKPGGLFAEKSRWQQPRRRWLALQGTRRALACVGSVSWLAKSVTLEDPRQGRCRVVVFLWISGPSWLIQRGIVSSICSRCFLVATGWPLALVLPPFGNDFLLKAT